MGNTFPNYDADSTAIKTATTEEPQIDEKNKRKSQPQSETQQYISNDKKTNVSDKSETAKKPPASKNRKEMRREWTRQLKREMRATDRQIRKTQNEKRKLNAEMIRYSKQHDADDENAYRNVKIMAKSIVLTDKDISHLRKTKVMMNSIVMQFKEQQKMDRVYEKSVVYGFTSNYSIPDVVKDLICNYYRIHVCIFKYSKHSDELQASIDKLIRIPQLQHTMMKIEKDMIESGAIIQMIGGDDILVHLMHPDSDDMDEEVDKIIIKTLNLVPPVVSVVSVIDDTVCKCRNTGDNCQHEDMLDLQTRLANLQ